MTTHGTHKPESYPTLVPALSVPDVAEALAFYERAFGAVEALRLTLPNGALIHAEMRLGDSLFSLGTGAEDLGNRTPAALGATSVVLTLYVDDADAAVARAVQAGAETVVPVADQFYGHRSGRVRDPFGHIWIVGAEIEPLTEAEMQRRMEETMG